MIIDCVADLHGNFPKLSGGDLLIVAGDLTATHTTSEMAEAFLWIKKQPYKKKILVAGNHDIFIPDSPQPLLDIWEITYLCDSGTEFQGLKIFGSPWTKTFPGINPNCMAFTVDTEGELAERWRMIPKDTNILITHCPSFGNFDYIHNKDGSKGLSVGSITLWMEMLTMIPNLQLHVTGHIHEAYGHCTHPSGIHLVNASHVNERYEPVNKPIRVIL